MANYHCTYCQNAILTCRIQCDECSDFDLCLQCFACGVETGTHKKEHDYRVLEDAKFAVFDGADAWSAEDEESFLDSVEQYGFGNWEDVAKLMKTKTAEECKEHYYTFYVHGNIGKFTFPNEKPNKTVDHTCPEGGPLSPSITAPLPPLELSLIEQQELGYMPLRDDFEREYDNDAETLVSSLSLNYDDEDIDIAFKLAQVDIYRQRWKNRQRCKHIAREYTVAKQATTVGIAAAVTPKKSQPQSKKERKVSKEEKDLTEKLKPFARFHSMAEHDQLLENLQKEKRFKAKIKELAKYRRNGITKLDECNKYDAERLARDKKRENRKKMGTSNLKTISMGTNQSKNVEDADAIIIDGDIKPSNGKKDLATLQNNGLLSARERRLCRSIGIKPASYITIKTCIIKDYLSRRQGIPVKIRYPNHLDKTHRRRILSFLSENGWIGGVGSV